MPLKALVVLSAGWSGDPVMCDPDEPWDANDAVSEEALIFSNSGAVTHKPAPSPLADRALTAMARLDAGLARRFPRTCALQRSVALQRA